MRTTSRKENMGQGNFKKPFEFNSFIEIFYCGMTRLRYTSLGVFIQSQYTRTILKSKNMRQILFKKHTKFQNFDEILYCGMTRFRNVKLGAFSQYHIKKLFQKRKIWDRIVLRNFQISKILILFWLSQTRGKWIAYGLIWLTQKNCSKKWKCWTNLP